MTNIIVQYQNAFNLVLDRLKDNKSVLAVMVFGSMVSGDLWDESDIDLFVVVDDELKDIKNIYTEENEVPIHIKLMSKDKFLNLHEKDLRGGFIHRIFASSRLVYSNDTKITARYDNGRYYPDLDRERWNMVYLGVLIKNISLCKKYLSNNRVYTAYSIAVKCVEDYSKLYVNSSGYMISKDAMNMAMNLNDNFRKCVDGLFFNKVETNEGISLTLKYLKEQIDKDIKNLSNLLLDYMTEKDCFLSTEDIKNDALFKDFDIDFEEILNRLFEKNIIKKDRRDFRDSNNNILIKENVYFI